MHIAIFLKFGDLYVGGRPKQGGVICTYIVGRSATVVKVLTREKLSLTFDLLLEFAFDH